VQLSGATVIDRLESIRIAAEAYQPTNSIARNPR